MSIYLCEGCDLLLHTVLAPRRSKVSFVYSPLVFGYDFVGDVFWGVNLHAPIMPGGASTVLGTSCREVKKRGGGVGTVGTDSVYPESLGHPLGAEISAEFQR